MLSHFWVLEIMETAPKFLRPLLGYYEIDDYYDQINPEYLRAKAKPLNVVNTLLIHSIPVKGIYTYRKESKEHFICRTYLGYPWPSSFSLILEPQIHLVPHIARVIYGVFILIFCLFGIFAAIGAFIENWQFGIMFIIAMSLFITLIILFLRWEKRVPISGFVYASAEN